MAFTDPILVIGICITIVRPALAVGGFEVTDICKPKPCPAGTKLHCLVDENWKQGQICLEHRMISKGKCPYYNTYQGNLDVRSCMEIKDIEACPSAPYQSYDGSRYSGCMMDYRNMNVDTGITTSKNTTVSMTTDPLIMAPTTKIAESNNTGAFLGSNEEKKIYRYPPGTPPDKPYVVAVAVSLLCTIILVISLIVFIKRKRIWSFIKRSEYDKDANIHRNQPETKPMLPRLPTESQPASLTTVNEVRTSDAQSSQPVSEATINEVRATDGQSNDKDDFHDAMSNVPVYDILTQSLKNHKATDQSLEISPNEADANDDDTEDNPNHSIGLDVSKGKDDDDETEEKDEKFSSCLNLEEPYSKDEKHEVRTSNDNEGKDESISGTTGREINSKEIGSSEAMATQSVPKSDENSVIETECKDKNFESKNDENDQCLGNVGDFSTKITSSKDDSINFKRKRNDDPSFVSSSKDEKHVPLHNPSLNDVPQTSNYAVQCTEDFPSPEKEGEIHESRTAEIDERKKESMEDLRQDVSKDLVDGFQEDDPRNSETASKSSNDSDRDINPFYANTQAADVLQEGGSKVEKTEEAGVNRLTIKPNVLEKTIEDDKTEEISGKKSLDAKKTVLNDSEENLSVNYNEIKDGSTMQKSRNVLEKSKSPVDVSSHQKSIKERIKYYNELR